jgi:hypothetical protein
VPLQPAERAEFKRALLEAVAAAPGVASVAEVRHVPLGGTGSSATITVAGAGPADGMPIRLNGVTTDFFDAMGMTIVSGRSFGAADARDAPIAVVTSSLARRSGLGADPVGSLLRIEGSDVVLEIVGMIGDAKYFDLREEPVPTAFLPKQLLPDARSYTDFVIRSNAPQDALRESVTRAVASVGGSMGVEVRAFDDIIGQGVVEERLMSTLSAFFGVLAALVAAIGLYGVMSQHVARRRSEIGVRIALGAGRGDVLAMVLIEAAALLVAGLAVGAALAFLAAGPAKPLLFGLDAYMVPVYGATVVLLTAAAAVACYVPARRAVRVDPREAFTSD